MFSSLYHLSFPIRASHPSANAVNFTLKQNTHRANVPFTSLPCSIHFLSLGIFQKPPNWSFCFQYCPPSSIPPPPKPICPQPSSQKNAFKAYVTKCHTFAHSSLPLPTYSEIQIPFKCWPPSPHSISLLDLPTSHTPCIMSNCLVEQTTDLSLPQGLCTYKYLKLPFPRICVTPPPPPPSFYSDVTFSRRPSLSPISNCTPYPRPSGFLIALSCCTLSA